MLCGLRPRNMQCGARRQSGTYAMAANHYVTPTLTGITAHTTKAFQMFSDAPSAPAEINPLLTLAVT